MKISLSWATKQIDFLSGKYQMLRRRIHAKKSYQFTVSGGRADYDWLLSFYNEHFGQQKPFTFQYDGNAETVYFGSTLQVKVKREVGVIVGFTAEIALEVDKRSGLKLPTPKTTDELPKATAEVTHSIDWDIKKIEMAQSVRRRKNYKKAKQKLSVKFKGLKKERDKIIQIYESHEMLPCLFPFDGKKIKVQLPTTLTITDYREIKQIVGYSCDMDLTVVN